ncbi:hypothetical protein [Pedobacter sp. Hv1]|uniref:hypothetical protein n=1 Tax=Pedobacter sp. Hv1 TaxID=1740090 RepID=UPI000A7AF9D0|nr:hypothetical protein [Pedobacter sp. Hv1]
MDQNSAILAQEMALIPGSSLIDGRTEIDRLSFLSNFASVINFYNHDNTINGNWAPFLLKDPAFLLAHISKTKVEKILSAYLITCNQIEPIVKKQRINRALFIGMNNLFDQLTTIFVRIERWTHYMQVTDIDYELKKYVLHQVKNTYSAYFWAIMAIREDLSLLPYGFKIKAVPYEQFNHFDEQIWKQSRNKIPYWEVLGIAHQVDENSRPLTVYTAIQKIGNELLNFLEAIVTYAAKEYETVKSEKGKYPDTLLLRTFVDLLGNYKDQLNEVSQKHLQFYYQDILKQSIQPAVADQALVFATLAKTDTTFTLPAYTSFNGGVDAQKNPILFANQTAVNLNPATITGAYTIAKCKDTGSFPFTALQAVSNPTSIQKDEDGKVKSWKFFGDQSLAIANALQTGFIISSPLLLLREGKRTVTLEFENIDFSPFFEQITFYLSTQNRWLLVNKPVDVKLIANNSIQLTIHADAPEIEIFLKNPEKIASSWPMLKMEFAAVADLTTLLQTISAIDLSVTVTGVKTFQLYNDFGPISAKNPYQPFGSIPLLNSNFIIGNNEIFSKQLSSFNMEIDWNNLPPSFLFYYLTYNKYLVGSLVKLPLLKRFTNWLFGKNKTADLRRYPFHNQCFTGDFKLLQDGEWKTFGMLATAQLNDGLTTTVAVTAPNATASVNEILPSLFAIQDQSLVAQSYFSYLPVSNPAVTVADPTVVDPSIQNITAFKYTDSSTSGFMKIVLSGNPYGFGSGIYSNVVAQVATYNSWLLYNSATIDELIPPANLPFAPKVSGLTVNYSASAQLNGELKYPFQCYSYSPMATDPFVFNLKETTVSTSAAIGSVVNSNESTSTNGLLFAPNYNGFLFLEMDNLAPTESLNFYFELTRDQVALSQSESKAAYYYLNENGWHALTVVADETANFSCSGIVSLAVPTQIAQQDFMGKGKKYWFCITADTSTTTFANVVFLQTNGFVVQREGHPFLSTQLPSQSITKPQFAIPQIATLIQPFPSFGGKVEENTTQMNQRVSMRLKTKDRVLTSEDYFWTIKQNYPDVYYTKTLFDNRLKISRVYLVKAYSNWQEANAFTPLLSTCQLKEINQLLTEGASGLSPIQVSNFEFNPVYITADLLIKQGYAWDGVKRTVNQALCLYLSPWIVSDQPTITIDQGIDLAALITFIKGIPGVDEAKNVTWNYTNEINYGAGKLIVSCMEHHLSQLN